MASGEGSAKNIPSDEKDSEKDSIAKETSGSANHDVDDDKGDDDLVIDEQNEAEKSDENESDEKEFEPTLDMMMNDFDDEQTMEEEEANEDQEDEADELARLEQEQDMPIEELLKMYGAAPGGAEPEESNDKEELPEENIENIATTSKETKVKSDNSVDDTKTSSMEVVNTIEENVDDSKEDTNTNNKRRGSGSPTPPTNKKTKSELARFYEAAVEGRNLRSQGGKDGDEMEEEEEDEPEDSDSEKQDYSWKKTIMIGPSYQAAVPSDLASYGDTLPYENEDKLLWHPGQLESKDVEQYLSKSQEAIQSSGVSSLPLGAHVRDDEQALYLLLQCGYNSDEALRRRRMNAIPIADTMTLWSEEECRAFELGLRLYGKDFHMIQSQKVRTRSVGELVQFYYLWKKTERHDVFANNTRLEKKKYTLHPGTTDYMDRFIDEQDPSRDRSSSPNFYSLMFGGQDSGRKGLSLHPGATKSNVSHGDSNGANESAIDSATANVPTSANSHSTAVNSAGSTNTSTSATNGRINDSEKDMMTSQSAVNE